MDSGKRAIVAGVLELWFLTHNEVPKQVNKSNYYE
jgi:hypothetical protein